MTTIQENFLKMTAPAFFHFAFACHDLTLLRSLHHRTDIAMIFTGIILHLFLSLPVFGDPTGSRNQSNHWCQKSIVRLLTVKYDCYSNLKESTINNRISLWAMSIGALFLAQIVTGIMGNFSLLYHYLFLYCIQSRLKATDLILSHLTLANFFLILSKAVPKTMAGLGLTDFMSGFTCQFHLYVYRVARGVSIGTTCLLSVYQTITISPMNSCWKELKVRAPKCVGCSLSFCWILYILVNLIFPTYVSYVSGQWSNIDTVKKMDLQDCFSVDHEKILGSIYSAVIVFPEVLFSVLIIWSSGFMVFILFRHKHRVQHIHRTNLSPRPSAESRATQSILLLLSTFICFHTLFTMFSICLSLYQNTNEWLVKITDLISLGFPTVSPFLLMSRESTLCRVFSAYIRTRKSPVLMRNMVGLCTTSVESHTSFSMYRV